MRNQTIATTLITWTTSAIITWYRLGHWFPTGGPGTSSGPHTNFWGSMTSGGFSNLGELYGLF